MPRCLDKGMSCDKGFVINVNGRAFWKKEGMLDQIEVCLVTPQMNLAHATLIHKKNKNKWGKPHEIFMGEDVCTTGKI